MNCRICSDGRVRTKLRKDDVEIFECASCRVAFWRPDPSFAPAAIYDAAYFDDATVMRGYGGYAGMEAALRASFARRLARLLPTAPGGRLLDVGAAYGFALTEAARVGWRALGVEISPHAARRAARRAPGQVVTGSALDLPFASASFEAVTLWDVLEHLPDPHRAIQEVARVLAPGGRLVLTTGDVGSLAARLSGARWHLYTLPEHLFFHSRRSLVTLLGAHGLRVARLRADASVYPLGYLVERLRKSLLGRPPRRAARFPGAGLLLPVNLFDVLTVTACKDGKAPLPPPPAGSAP